MVNLKQNHRISQHFQIPRLWLLMVAMSRVVVTTRVVLYAESSVTL